MNSGMYNLNECSFKIQFQIILEIEYSFFFLWLYKDRISTVFHSLAYCIKRNFLRYILNPIESY